MTAPTPPIGIQPLSVNLDSITNGKMKGMPMKNKGRTNYTTGYSYTIAPVVVSEPSKKITSCRNTTEATQDYSNDVQSQTPLKPSGYSISLEKMEPHLSPNSVVPMHADIQSCSAPAPPSTSSMEMEPLPKQVLSTSEACEQEQACTVTPQFRRVKTEQNYDMNLVPMIKKNPLFLKAWRKVSLANQDNERSFSNIPSTFSLPSLVCDGSYGDESNDHDPDHSEGTGTTASVSCDSSSSSMSGQDKEPHEPCHACLVPRNTASLSPFASNFQSVIWAPKTRLDWEESIDEMVAVCSAAAWHKHRSNRSKKNKDFNPPISRIYIRDRIEIDDPLRGYQVRHKIGGWLQGFVMMTNFTTWTHYFKWDSRHTANGIDLEKTPGASDEGSLAEGLERQPRSGDPLGEGVVWPTIAEMSLVGALGCGEYLLQMALDDISRRGTYDYVVLEATDTSRPFYEKFGFIRVGAVCKYGNEKDVKDANGEVQDVGYRHWTYATETEQRLNEHGAPSCMMARRIKKFDPTIACEGCGNMGSPSFVDQLGRYFVLDKPKIQPLGATKRKRSMSGTNTQNVQAMKKLKTVPVNRVTSSGRKSKTPSRLEQEEDATKQKRPTPISNKTDSGVKKPNIAPKKRSAPGRTSTAVPSRTSKNSSLPPIAPLESVLKSRGKNNKSILLRKQKIPTMHRSPKKLYFYNKVVTPKSSQNVSKYKSKYYFVISYDIDADKICIIPLYLRGTFKGKREGRPKWKANVLPRQNVDDETYLNSMNVISAPSSNWDIVKSYAVTKCASVQEESWDVLV